MTIFFGTLLVLLVIGGNVLWYWLKYDLKKRGFEIRIFTHHFHDIKNALKVVQESEDLELIRKYKFALRGLLIVLILLPICFVSFFFSTM